MRPEGVVTGDMALELERSDPASPPSLAYVRRVYANVFEWYRIADSKAQLLLTIDGIFITVLATNAFSKPQEAVERTDRFGWETWMLFGLTGLAVVASVCCAAMCLRSRLSNSQIDKHIRDYFVGVKPSDPGTYTSKVSFWFGTLAVLKEEGVEAVLRGADAEFEVDALTSQVWHLSRNVLSKHRWVNRGWLLAAASLVSLAAAASSYLLRA
jgi:hypothetical protein